MNLLSSSKVYEPGKLNNPNNELKQTPNLSLLVPKKANDINSIDNGKNVVLGLDNLSDDSIICIMEFISSPSILFNFAQISKRIWNLVHASHPKNAKPKSGDKRYLAMQTQSNSSSSYIEKLMKGIYIHKLHVGFHFHIRWSWKEEWERLYTFKKALQNVKKYPLIKIINPATWCKKGGSYYKKGKTRRSRLGILTREEENSSIGYDDESRYGRDLISLGYFGINSFSYDPNFPSLQAVAICGDFCGVRIFPCLSSLLYKPFIRNSSKEKKKTLETSAIQSIGQNKSQVLVILPNPPSSSSCTCRQKQKHKDENIPNRPCFFLGFADGSVMAVFASTNEHYITSYTSTTTDAESQHSDEVTTLCFLPVSTLSQSDCRSDNYACTNKILASGGVDGTVLIYPHAVCHGILSNPIQALTNDNVGILSMDSCTDVNANLGTILFTGDLQGKVTVWKSKGGCWSNEILQKEDNESKEQKIEEDDLMTVSTIDSNKILNPNLNTKYKYHFMPFVPRFIHSCSPSSGTYTVNITKVSFVMEKYLITGHNNGELRFWKYSSELTEIKLLHFHPKAHSGAVEAMKINGDVLLTCGGGKDGIKTWNVLTGEYICQIKDHSNSYGKLSAVVGFLMERQSIIWLKRCGILQEWNFYDQMNHSDDKAGHDVGVVRHNKKGRRRAEVEARKKRAITTKEKKAHTQNQIKMKIPPETKNESTAACTTLLNEVKPDRDAHKETIIQPKIQKQPKPRKKTPTQNQPSTSNGNEAKSWTCRFCQYFNRSQATNCEICGKLKKRKTAEAALISIQCSTDLNCLTTSTLSKAQSLRKWECRKCHFRNFELDQACENCGGPANRRKRIIVERDLKPSNTVKQKKKRPRPQQNINSVENSTENFERHDHATKNAFQENSMQVAVCKNPLHESNLSVDDKRGDDDNDDDSDDDECIMEMVRSQQKKLRAELISSDFIDNPVLRHDNGSTSLLNGSYDSEDDDCINDMVQRQKHVLRENNKLPVNEGPSFEDASDEDECISKMVRKMIERRHKFEEFDEREISRGRSMNRAEPGLKNKETTSKSNIFLIYNRKLRSLSNKSELPTISSNLENPNLWMCQQCTYHNRSEDYACIICFRSKPSSRRIRS